MEEKTGMEFFSDFMVCASNPCATGECTDVLNQLESTYQCGPTSISTTTSEAVTTGETVTSATSLSTASVTDAVTTTETTTVGSTETVTTGKTASSDPSLPNTSVSDFGIASKAAKDSMLLFGNGATETTVFSVGISFERMQYYMQ